MLGRHRAGLSRQARPAEPASQGVLGCSTRQGYLLLSCLLLPTRTVTVPVPSSSGAGTALARHEVHALHTHSNRAPLFEGSDRTPEDTRTHATSAGCATTSPGLWGDLQRADEVKEARAPRGHREPLGLGGRPSHQSHHRLWPRPSGAPTRARGQGRVFPDRPRRKNGGWGGCRVACLSTAGRSRAGRDFT